MRNLLLVEKNNVNLLQEIAKNLGDYRTRKIHDGSTLAAHVKEFEPDLIVFHLDVVTDEFFDELGSLATITSMPLLVFAEECASEHISRLIQADVCYLGIDALPSASIDQLIEIAFARFKQVQILKHALEEARAQLEDRKQIDRAKAILIKTRNFSEDEAYHTLRKLAMGRNVTLGEMARNVIAMADLLK